MVIIHSYVSLPEGKPSIFGVPPFMSPSSESFPPIHMPEAAPLTRSWPIQAPNKPSTRLISYKVKSKPGEFQFLLIMIVSILYIYIYVQYNDSIESCFLSPNVASCGYHVPLIGWRNLDTQPFRVTMTSQEHMQFSDVFHHCV